MHWVHYFGGYLHGKIGCSLWGKLVNLTMGMVQVKYKERFVGRKITKGKLSPLLL